ncbi:hypothetical protein GCM10007874_40100 [Labrys miyagiensis]|uniref:Uncharacterized protein n=2 Tax=Labrys miyagiensis TaxID=346912 RepID=A0ABQ6CMI8_9HYPH|nr:hypothetical protein GCM10007874_40100 [Labrys miyagiensis]
MLMLGAQVLLGFQFQAPFQDAFGQLSQTEKTLELLLLVIMTVVIGLLIAPSAHHRIVYDGRATASLDRFVAQMSELTLAPFSTALALNLAIAASRTVGITSAWITGIASCAFTTLLWYAPALANKGGKPVTTSDDKTPLEAKIDYVLTEARVILPGAQAMLGFQLAIVLTSGFVQLPSQVKTIHGFALGLIAISTVLLITPATYHRLVYAGNNEPSFHRLASRLLLSASIFLALGLAADTYVVALKISENSRIAVSLALIALVVLAALWIVWPWLLRRKTEREHA